MGEALLVQRGADSVPKNLIAVDGEIYEYTNTAAATNKTVTFNKAALVTNKYSNIVTFSPSINNVWFMRVKVVFDDSITYKSSSTSSYYFSLDINEDATQEFYVKATYASGQEIVLGTVTYGTRLTVTVKLVSNKLRFVYSWSSVPYDVGTSTVTKVSYELFWD